MASMAQMDRSMMAAPMTGNPDHDFSAMMIPHHQGAIEMAKALLLHGRDPALRRLDMNGGGSPMKLLHWRHAVVALSALAFCAAVSLAEEPVKEKKKEADEYFTALLSSPSSDASIANDTGWGTILNDDGPKGPH